MPPKAKKSTANTQGGLAPPGKHRRVQPASGRLYNGPSETNCPRSTGKRIQKPKPNGLLSGPLANGHRQSPSPASSASEVTPTTPAAAQTESTTARDGDMDRKMEGAGTSNGSLHRSHSPPASPGFTMSSNTSKNTMAFNGNMFTIAATIIRTCPLQDVITILIVLLQLPPAFLTAVNLLYAALTFIPSSTNTSLSSLPSLNDMFLGSGGTPSLYAIIGADLVMLILWSVLWAPAQNFAYDMAQAVIAISLGGAAAGRGGTFGTLVWCMLVISCMNLFRPLRPVRQDDLTWTRIFKLGLWQSEQATPSPTSSALRQSPSKIRSVLAIHILAQGLVRIIRRWLFRREASQTIPTSKKNDPEAAPNINIARSNSVHVADSGPEVGSNSSTDGRQPGPSPAGRDGKERAVNLKKKRRQATHVRSQQPFWAALASTKVSVFKEMEQTQAAVDALEANATDANHMGEANFFQPEEDRVWISEVGSTEISFGANLVKTDLAQGQEETVSSSHLIDKTKPFYVRINGADWTSTRFREVTQSVAPDEKDSGREVWSGEIFGLTALSNYYCEFVRVLNGAVIASASLITQAAQCDEQATISSPPPHGSLRPASPVTTLKNSAIQNEKTLNDAKNRLKRNRRDHRSSLTAAKKEVDSLNSRLASSGGNDDRQRQRVLQLNQSIRVADEATTSLSDQVNKLGDVPEEDISSYEAQKERWRSATEKKAAARRELEEAKAEGDREVTAMKSEVNSVLQKRERLQARKSKLDEQHDRLTATNAMNEDVRQQQALQRLRQAEHRAREEQNYRQQISHMQAETATFNFKAQQASQAIASFENLYHNPPPMTPEGPLPGTRGNQMMHSPSNMANFQFPQIGSNFMSSHTSTPNSTRDGGRGRSSSLLSGVSNFTEDVVDDRYMVNGTGDGSHSSGSPGPIGPPTQKPSPTGFK